MKLLLMLILAAVVIALPACTDEEATPQPAAETTASPDQPNATDAGGQTVDLEIIEGAGGSVIVFVPITIQGEGPFDFVLDTGASRSVIDASVTEQLGLAQTESPGDVSGIEGTTEVNLVDVEDWQMGENVALPATQVTTFSLFATEDAEMIEGQIGREVQGLLGSDVLATFGLIAIDFDTNSLSVGR